MARDVYWRGGASLYPDDVTFDGTDNWPGGAVSANSNWVLEDGTPTRCPEDNDTVIFDEHAMLIPLADPPNGSPGDDDAPFDDYIALLSDPYHADRWYQGHERGKHWGPFLFGYKRYASGDYYWSYEFFGDHDFAKIIVAPTFTGRIGFRRIWNAVTARWDRYEINAMPCHCTAWVGGIWFKADIEAHIRCSGRVDRMVWRPIPEYWEDLYGDADEDVTIAHLTIQSKRASIFISSQLNESAHRSKWTVINGYGSGCNVIALAEEEDKFYHTEGSHGWDGYFESAIGTVIGGVFAVSPNFQILIESECVDKKSGANTPADVELINSSLICHSPLGTLINKAGIAEHGKVGFTGQVNVADIESLKSYGGVSDIWAAGTIKAAEIFGGQVRLLGDTPKVLGDSENSIQLKGGMLDCSQASGVINLGSVVFFQIVKTGGELKMPPHQQSRMTPLLA